MTEEIDVGLPEDAVEAQDDLVEVAEAETFDGSAFPFRKRWIEANRVGLTRLLFNRNLQHAECQC